MMRALAVLALLALPGCFDVEPAASATVEEEAPGYGSIPAFLHLQDCMGFSATQTYGPGMNPARPPPGWSMKESEESTVSMLLLRCERAGLDGLERPATLLWESASNAILPEDCMGNSTSRYQSVRYLVNVVTDDTGLADRLRSYGLPVHEGTFETAQNAGSRTLSWSVHGSASSITVVDEGTRHPADPHPGRWVWANDTASGWMDVQEGYRSSEGMQNRVGHGVVSEPHVLGVEGMFAGLTLAKDDARLEGAIQLRGRDCA